MKKTSLLMVLAFMACFYASTFYFTAAAEEAKPCASLTSVSGPIKYSGANSQDFILYNPDVAKLLKLMDRDRILTGDYTVAELLVAGAARIAIREKSEVQVGFNNLRIKNGDIWVNYKPSKTGDKLTFKVFTPAGTLGIRGTSFGVRVAEITGDTSVKVTEGLVSFETPDGAQNVFISRGEELTVKPGEKPGTPSKIKAGEEPSGRGETIRKNIPADENKHAKPKYNGRGSGKNSMNIRELYNDMSGYSVEIIDK
ncbi:MAG: hypothetical protein A2008_02330 [Candidatus Wallbacteria bacterium GWC2_49_35]|uniref:FecR protein domain-containing protein n=1 Tax=Candidatus Wallbacteria bacterium GWC2_49_35 TaxID=1817813 RepID=A0A1F7X093_9BACT|nr:MAG: hypothetical protein A2008_02330 [Candidatus Wallbacteria bacterium GWC2_49_35]HBC75802.1 hypothetical protein [Candidatus Wallbacteria bacterium]